VAGHPTGQRGDGRAVPLCPLYIVVRWREENARLNREISLSSFSLCMVPQRTAQGGRQPYRVRGSAAGKRIQKIYFHNFTGSDLGASLSIVCVQNYEVQPLAALDIIRQDFILTLRLATSTNTLSMLLRNVNRFRSTMVSTETFSVTTLFLDR
jgi:hypothetical protein